jgi:hypothetical protein
MIAVPLMYSPHAQRNAIHIRAYRPSCSEKAAPPTMTEQAPVAGACNPHPAGHHVALSWYPRRLIMLGRATPRPWSTHQAHWPQVKA